MKTLRPITRFNFETIIIRQSKIFQDVMIAWKDIDEIDQQIWKNDPKMVCPSEGIRVQTLGM